MGKIEDMQRRREEQAKEREERAKAARHPKPEEPPWSPPEEQPLKGIKRATKPQKKAKK